MGFALTIIGSNSAIPSHGRHPSAQILNTEKELFLIDCGEGTQIRLSQLQVKKFKISRIFISHLHGDHVYGLPGLLTTMSLLGRERPLQIVGPVGIREMIQQVFHHTGVVLGFPLDFLEANCKTRECLIETEDLRVFGFPLDHRVVTNGYLFQEKPRPRHLDGEKADRLQIPFEWRDRLKKGEDYVVDNEVVIKSHDITFPPDSHVSFAYCSDTSYSPQIIPWVKEADCLYHESTFLHDLAHLAAERYHSTAAQAAQIARDANVRQLIIGHISSRYEDFSAMVEEARSIFPNTEAAEEGTEFHIK